MQASTLLSEVQEPTGDGRDGMPCSSIKGWSRETYDRARLLSALIHPACATDALAQLSPRAWRRNLPWLDTSGIALYLYGALCDDNQQSYLPAAVSERWAQNLVDNRTRMADLESEARDLHRVFQRAHLRYATLKGFSLLSHSVPQMDRRSQLDLDFLIAEDDASTAREALEQRGYTLRSISGRSWEFKNSGKAATSLSDIYKPLPFRSVELHLEYANTQHPLLTRLQWQQFGEVDMPVLHPADLFVGQGLHLFKHICSEFFRVAHLFELRRHIVTRFHDEAFWHEVRVAAADEPRATHGLGVAIALITQVGGIFAPSALTSWTSDCLPAGACRWIKQFGPRVTFSSFPGSKLYLLLQQELAQQSVPARRTVRASLVPKALPPRITLPRTNEKLMEKLQRNRHELSYILFRLRFHVVQGARYFVEARRWKNAGARVLMLAILLGLTAVVGHAQQGTASPLLYGPSEDRGSAQTNRLPPSTADGTSTLSADNRTSVLTSQTVMPVSLSAGQITGLLQSNPDALTEVKQLVSDAASQQGQALPVDSITDQMLFTRIATSPELRANITVFLRARGYISDSDLPLASEVPDTATDGQSFRDPQLDNNLPSSVRRTTLPTKQATGKAAEAKEQQTPEPKVLHRPAPYNLRALHDLYTQVTDDQTQLKRFGADMFLRRDALTAQAMAASSSMDVAPGNTYVLAPGDSLIVQVWGGISQSINRTVDREGFVTLPEAGQVQIAGMTLERAQASIATALQRQYRNAQVAITLSRLRSVRIYVVGDVQRPGAYDISVLGSPISALYAAGGPTAIGSLRVLRQYRGTRLIAEVDLYDFLLHGVQSEARLQSGDTLLVPPAGPQVAVSGAVKRPAIYELKGASTLASVLEDAGTATVSAELAHITIERVQPNKQRETVDLNLPLATDAGHTRSAIAAYPVQDGDHVRVSPIEPYSQRAIYTEGHLLRPGRMAWHDGMRLGDVLKSYRDLLPEPADRGEIVRLMPPDLHVETIEFSVPDLMIGNSNPTLQPLDTIRIFSRYEVDAPKVSIDGEVLHPGSYPMSQGMTASQLLQMAGGFTRAALLTTADLTSYNVVDGTRIESQRTAVRIGDAVIRNDASADIRLKARDLLSVHKLTGWDDIGATIIIEGEVAHPGQYGFQQGERLSSILKRAGGLRDTSYPDGAVLIRPDVQALEEKSRQELIRQIETSSSAARIAPSIAPGDSAAQLQLVQAQQDQILAHLKSEPAVGRLVIHISPDIASWENTPADIEVRAGDVLRIPKRPGFVLVSGQVYNSSAITFAPGKTAGWYLRRAGGATEVANTKEIFVIRANGSVVGRETGALFHHDVLATQLEAGDVVVIPQKIMGASIFWRNLLTVAQIASSIAITAAVAGVL